MGRPPVRALDLRTVAEKDDHTHERTSVLQIHHVALDVLSASPTGLDLECDDREFSLCPGYWRVPQPDHVKSPAWDRVFSLSTEAELSRCLREVPRDARGPCGRTF